MGSTPSKRHSRIRSGIFLAMMQLAKMGGYVESCGFNSHVSESWRCATESFFRGVSS